MPREMAYLRVRPVSKTFHSFFFSPTSLFLGRGIGITDGIPSSHEYEGDRQTKITTATGVRMRKLNMTNQKCGRTKVDSSVPVNHVRSQQF